MKYSPDIVHNAFSELDQRRQKAINEYNRHIEKISQIPELYSLYEKIHSAKDKLSSVILSKSSDVKAEIEKIRDENLNAQKKLSELLALYGFENDYLSIKYHCPLCNDTGYRMGDRCECINDLLEKYNVLELNRHCKIRLHNFSEFNLDYYPENVTYKGKTINAKETMENNLKFCIDYVNCFSNDSCGIVFLGDTGLGKTFLSSCIAFEVLKKGYSVAFDSIQNYLRDIEKEHFGRAEGDTLETLLNADLLILDDLGSEFSSSFNNASIYNLINSRTNIGKPTIISTNLTLEELKTRYDNRLISRIFGTFETLRFFGNDIRLEKKMRKE